MSSGPVPAGSPSVMALMGERFMAEALCNETGKQHDLSGYVRTHWVAAHSL